MSIIQTIREKAAWLLFILIAIALLGFILMDYSGRGSGGGGSSLGKINGNNIYYQNFETVYQSRLELLKLIGINTANEQLATNASNTLWKLYEEQIALEPIFEEAGFTVTENEVQKVITGQFPVQEVMQEVVFQNPNSRQYDPNYVMQVIQVWKNSKDPKAQILLNFYNRFIKVAILKHKYLGLFLLTSNVPVWLKNEYEKENLSDKVSYVKVPYYAVVGNNAKNATTKEAEKFADKYASFLPKGEARTMNYVWFDATPTQVDSQTCYNEIDTIKTQFAQAKNADILINESTTVGFNFSNQFLPEKAYNNFPEFDKIKVLPINQVFGIYIGRFGEDASYESNYILAKVTDTKVLPDSVKFRHLIIAVPKDATPEVEANAKVKIDSLFEKIKKGAKFEDLIKEYSEDQSTKDKGGEYTFTYEQSLSMDSTLSKNIFEGKPGEKKIIKTIYGYHIIEVLSQTHPQKLYKIAIAYRKIKPGTETINKAITKASQFSALVGTKSTEVKFAKTTNQLSLKEEASQLIPSDIATPFLHNLYSRELIRFIFRNDKNAVSQPIQLGYGYVVAMVTNIYQDAESSIPSIISYLSNQYQMASAYDIVVKETNSMNLDAIATKYKQKVDTAHVNFMNLTFGTEGLEAGAVGASFNINNVGKISKAVKGNTGIFFIQGNKTPINEGNSNLQILLQNKEVSSMNNVYNNLYNNFLRNAKIKDNRNQFL